MQEPSRCPPSRHHSPRMSGGPGGPVSSEPTAGSFQHWTVGRSAQATGHTGAPPRPARVATAAGASGRVCTEWPWPGRTRSPGCPLQADVLLWPSGPACHPAPWATGQGPRALQGKGPGPGARPTPDGQAGLGRFAPGYAGAVGLSAHSTQSRVPGQHTSTETAGGEPRLDCAKAVCDIRRQCHGGLLTVQCPGPGLPGSPGGGGTGWKRRREPGTREAPGTSSWCHT